MLKGAVAAAALRKHKSFALLADSTCSPTSELLENTGVGGGSGRWLISMDVKTWNSSDRGARVTLMEEQQLDLDVGRGWLCPSHDGGVRPEFSAAAPHPLSAPGGRGPERQKGRG